ncbi:hypothetical protein CRBSH125_05810 [Afipia carboxidovorans]|nr:hypothetical protein CRBSH125_05810 [Afipia carboxidovorans]
MVRYLERVLGMNVAAIREQIEDDCRAAVTVGASSLKKDGFQYHFEGRTVLSVTPICNDGVARSTAAIVAARNRVPS